MKKETQYTDIKGLYTSASYIKQVYNHKRRIPAWIAMIVGGLLIALPSVIHVGSELSEIILTILGVFVLLGVLVHWLKDTQQFIYVPTGQTVRLGTATYDRASCPTLMKIMQEDLDSNHLTVMHDDPNGGIRVDYLVSKDHKMLAIISAKYENLMWLPICGHVLLYTDEEAEKAIYLLNIDC